MRYMMIVTAMLLLGDVFLAASWSLSECGPENADQRKKYEHLVRRAAPGSPLYLPKPFPKNREDIVQNYLYQYRRIWEDTPLAVMPADERPVSEAVQGGSLRFEVARVENWTSMRCGRRRDDFYHLLRIFDTRSGSELARTALSESGFIVVSSNATEREKSKPVSVQQKRLMPLDEGVRKAKTEYAVAGEDPQYVYTFGTLRCQVLTPCTAFRQRSQTYILSPKGELFHISGNVFRLALDGGPRSSQSTESLLRALAPDERLVSLGGPGFAIGRKVRRPGEE